MHGSDGDDNRRRPYGVLGSLVLILAVESTVASHKLDLTNTQRIEWIQSRKAATSEALACSVLSFGTSMTKMGLYPAVVERESGHKAYNLACCAGRLPGSYFLLRRALNAGARPEAIVLEVHPTYLDWPFRVGLTDWPDLLDPAEALELAWSARDASFFLATCLPRLLPSLGSRAELRVAIPASLRGEAFSFGPNTIPYRKNLTTNAGAFVLGRNLPYQGEVAPFLEMMYLNSKWSSDPLNEGYLRRILGLCSSRGIRVYWLIPPMAPALQSRREQQGLDAAYTHFVEKIQSVYPDVVVMDSRHSGYDASLFRDAAHLDHPGAGVLSAEVGRVLRRGHDPVQGRPNWVSLPAYRDRPIEAPPEEFTRSFQANAKSGTLKK
jgi:hypothetical protein